MEHAASHNNESKLSEDGVNIFQVVQVGGRSELGKLRINHNILISKERRQLRTRKTSQIRWVH